MRSLRRLFVLGVFAAAGVGIALSLGLSIEQPMPSAAAGRPDVPENVEPKHDLASTPAAAARSAVESVNVARTVSPSAPIPPALAAPPRRDDFPVPPGYAYAAARPALAGEPPTDSGVTLGPLLGALMKAGMAGKPAEAITTPQGQANGATPAAPPPKANITRSADEGDGRLSINIQDADIRQVLDMLSQQGNLNILASEKVQGKVSATLSGVDLNSALAAILKSTGFQARREGEFIFVGTLEDFTAMEHSVDRVGTRIFHPSYVKAKELETLITPLLTKDAGVVSVTSEAKTGIPSNISDVGGDAYAGTEALVVRDYEAVLAEVDQLVAEVDVRPMQVHIEAMILSVQLDDKDNFGVNFELLRKNDNLRLGWGTVPQSFAKFTFDGGLKFGFLDQNLGAFLDAIEKVGDTNVIATPRLMVLNKHAAEIQIGKSKGYVSTTQQTTTAATQTVEFLELGTLLRIRPFISPDGLIRMEIHPEISDGDVVVDQGITLPSKEVTQVTTNIMVRDGCTVVIGGLLQDEQKISRTQIPWLGNLPWVGVAFRNKNENALRRELIILITPHIVQEPGAYREGAEQRCEFERRHAVYAEHLSPISKQSLARRYIRKARNAWAAGDRTAALRLAEMAVQFDPRNREAIALRSDIWLGKPCTDQVLPESPEEPTTEEPIAQRAIGGEPTAEAMDGETIAPWVLDGLGQEKAASPAVAEPLDPAQRIPAPSTSVPGAAR